MGGKNGGTNESTFPNGSRGVQKKWGGRPKIPAAGGQTGVIAGIGAQWTQRYFNKEEIREYMVVNV